MQRDRWEEVVKVQETSTGELIRFTNFFINLFITLKKYSLALRSRRYILFRGVLAVVVLICRAWEREQLTSTMFGSGRGPQGMDSWYILVRSIRCIELYLSHYGTIALWKYE